jgi:HD-GYP domain-containing protein (c-di-GMP phosphodiesterase class II)
MVRSLRAEAEPLAEDEVAFIRRHTIIGESILCAAPALAKAAIAELRRCAGTQFDPMVVEAFCAALTEAPAPADAFAAARSV